MESTSIFTSEKSIEYALMQVRHLRKEYRPARQKDERNGIHFVNYRKDFDVVSKKTSIYFLLGKLPVCAWDKIAFGINTVN